jgi:hypothetical protein
MKKSSIFLILVLTTSSLFSQVDRKITYHDNGNKKELLTIYDNHLNGKCVAWNEDGVIIAKVYYVDGMKDGKWYMWHTDGTPAYQLRYNKNRKVGVWKFYDESGKLIGEKEYDPIYERNTTIILGTFTLSDLSISVTQRLNKNKPFVIGGEYATYIADGEYEDFTDFEKFQRHSILGTAGLVSNTWGMLLKAGTYFGYDHDEYLNEYNYTKFDYGVEMFLIIDDETMHIAPIMGISITKGMRTQLKFGINF